MVAEQPFLEERNLLSLIYKNAVDSRRAAWRVITSIEQNEKPEGKEPLASHAREYIAEVEGELQKIRDGILAIMDKNLIPLASTDETKVSYYRMKSDYYRYLAEFATGETKSKEDACVAYAEATKIAEKDLPVTALITDVITRLQTESLDVCMSQVVEQVGEVPKTSSRNRTSHCTAEQALDVPVPEIVKQVVEVPETVSQDRIQQRTVEQIADAPVPQAMEELAEVSKVFSQDRIQQRAVETVVQTQQGVTTHVQHVVNTIEVEKPKIIKETAQRKKPITQEKINQATKHVEVPEVPLSQFTDKVIDKPVVAQRQIPMVQAVQKTIQLQCVDEATDDPGVQVPRAQVVEKTVGIPQFQIVEKTIEAPQLQIGAQTSESLGSAPVRQVAQVSTTGVVKPDDPDAGIKFLAAEALHGVHGNRLANESGRRDCVTGEMWKNDCVTGEMWKKKPPFRLALNRAASDEIAPHCKHYTESGVRKLHESGTALAEDPEAPVSKMPDSSEAHDQASLKSAKDRDGEPYPAFASEKSRNEASGKTVAHRHVPLIQTVQKTVEVPRVQFIDRVVDDPAVMQRRASTIEVRDSQDYPRDPRRDSAGEQADEVLDATPFAKADRTKKRRKAEGDVDVERFNDLVLPSSQPGLERKVFYASMASSDEEPEQERAEARNLVQGGECTRVVDESEVQGPEDGLVPVAPNMGAGGSHPQATLNQEWAETRREGGCGDPEARAA